jgi:cell division protein FtsB
MAKGEGRVRKGGRASGSGGDAKDRVRRVLVGGVVVAVVYFAVQGGEYGTRDLIRQKQRKARLVKTIDSLRRAVDSLAQYKQRIQTDPAVQERIAREEFGMVRGNKELLYRFVESDSAARAP